MKIIFVSIGKSPAGNGDSRARGSIEADSVWMKAKGLSERGHKVWVLSPDSLALHDRRVIGVRHVHVGAILSGREGVPSAAMAWPALVAAELLRLHQDHDIDIVDISADVKEICSHLAQSSCRGRLPAIVQIGQAPQGRFRRTDAQMPLYRFDGQISFAPSNPVESHIAILRLENFFHGVLNRHLAAHLPAA